MTHAEILETILEAVSQHFTAQISFSDATDLRETIVNETLAEVARQLHVMAHLMPAPTSLKPLGKEFEKVLYENIWDLYES